MELEVLPSANIDRQKWDDCIKHAANSLIYATSVYLDHMADNWDGIVAEDYKFVMPVPWRKKLGVRYCYDVPFVQQLGIFGGTLHEEEINIFKNQLPRLCRYGDYSFNYTNVAASAVQRNNFILVCN